MQFWMYTCNIKNHQEFLKSPHNFLVHLLQTYKSFLNNLYNISVYKYITRVHVNNLYKYFLRSKTISFQYL